MHGLSFVRQMTWSEVFETWREIEAGIWEQVYKEKGFATWEEWRGSAVAPFLPEKRVWLLYQVLQPDLVIPQAWVGPFKGWKKYLLGKGEGRFRDALASPEIYDNEKFVGLLANFPSTTTLMGVRYGEEIAIFEGSHRAMAITMGVGEGRKIAKELFIILTDVASEQEFNRAHRQPE